MKPAFALLLVSATAAAEPRSFTETYEYPTLPEGEAEVALWHAQAQTAWHVRNVQRLAEQLQINYGVTDRFEAALFTVFTQTTDQAFAFEALRAEGRYRFVDRGEWPVDVALHGEAAKEFGRTIYDLTGRLELARDFDRVTTAGNLIVTRALGRDATGAQLELGWAAGVTYEVVPKLHVGAETWGGHRDGLTRTEVGPAIGIAPSPRLWLAVTAGFGVNDASDAFSGQLIVGLRR
ncbi:MAG: hypothetical protein ABI591_26340 [Kofleriaceae bacterium]